MLFRSVYVSGRSPTGSQLFVRSLDQLDATPFRGLSSPLSPFVSPDGQWVAFFDLPGILKKVAVTGGPPVSICTISGNGIPRGGSWGPDGTIVFAMAGGTRGLMKVSANGGNAEPLTKPDATKGEESHSFPEFLPNGRGILFVVTPQGSSGAAGSAVGSADVTGQIAVLDVRTLARKTLVTGGSNPRYAASGHIVYGVAGTLRAVAFDADRLEVRGTPVPVVEHVVTKRSGAADFGLAANGTLVYIAGDAGDAMRTLVWVDREGHEEPLGVPPRAYAYPRISPDGTRVALDVRDQENDVWIWDLKRLTLTRLTFDPGLNRGVAWTPDGRRLAFSAQRDGKENIYWQAADGTGSPERLTDGARPQVPISFTRDGKNLLFNEPDIPPADVGIVSMTPNPKTEFLLHAPYHESDGEVSPDGRWLAYQSTESGRGEVYVRPFPNIDSGRWQVSTGGGTRPAWESNGRELFYLAADGKLMAVPVQSGATYSAGTPQVVVNAAYLNPYNGRTYDVSPDGKRFLMIKEASTQPASPRQLVVVLNWFEELKRLVPRK